MLIKSAKRILRPVKKRYIAYQKKQQAKGKTKYFCVGRNKTGTTSLKKAFEDLGYPVGDQRIAEILADKYYRKGIFNPIIEYCQSAQVFQDVPFSSSETFKHLDAAYPGSKFILSVRDNPEQWYQSITRFHAKKWGKDGRIPTADDLKNATYIYKGSPYNLISYFGTSDDDPYNKEILIAHYNRHNQDVMDYFKDRPKDLLIINLAENCNYQRFVEFLGVKSPYDNFPWENRT